MNVEEGNELVEAELHDGMHIVRAIFTRKCLADLKQQTVDLKAGKNGGGRELKQHSIVLLQDFRLVLIRGETSGAEADFGCRLFVTKCEVIEGGMCSILGNPSFNFTNPAKVQSAISLAFKSHDDRRLSLLSINLSLLLSRLIHSKSECCLCVE
jgi:hypothetical protein